MSNNVVEAPSKAAIQSKSLASEGKKIAKGGIIVMLSTIIAQALGMITTVWIARELGPDHYGVLTLALAILLPLTTFATFGLDKAAVRFIPIHIGNKENKQVAGTLYTTLITAGVASTIVLVVVFFLAPNIAGIFDEERLIPVLRILAFTIPLVVWTTILATASRGLKVMHFDAIVKIARQFFRLLFWIGGLLILVNLFNAAVYASLFGGLLTFLVAIGVAFWGFRKYLKDGVKWAPRTLWLYSIPLVFSTLMYTLAPRIDRLVLGVVADVRTVGIYSAAASLILILKLVHSSITMTFSPIVADAYNRTSVTRAKRLYVMVTRWDARLTFLVAIVSVLLAKEILWLFGKDYSEAITPFIILSISVYLSTIPGPTGAFLQMTNRQRVDAVNALIFFILSPLIQLLFASWLGWIGVAVGVLATVVILNSLQVIEIHHFYRFHPFQRDHFIFTIGSIVIVILSAFFSQGLELPFRLAILGAVLVGFLIYSYIQRTPNDIMFFEMLLPKRKPF